MNFCNVRNSSGGSTEQMENQLPLMPSPVILLQIFIVEGFFHVCLVKLLWLGKREGEGERLHFRYLQVCQQYLRSIKKSKVADCPGITVTTKTFGNETTGIRSLHSRKMAYTTGLSKRKGKF